MRGETGVSSLVSSHARAPGWREFGTSLPHHLPSHNLRLHPVPQVCQPDQQASDLRLARAYLDVHQPALEPPRHCQLDQRVGVVQPKTAIFSDEICQIRLSLVPLKDEGAKDLCAVVVGGADPGGRGEGDAVVREAEGRQAKALGVSWDGSSKGA